MLTILAIFVLLWLLSLNHGKPYYPTRQELTEYYKTAHWRTFRKVAIRERGGCCEACGSTFRLNVHHWTYARMYRERISDVFLLCQFHHQLVHRLHRAGRYGRGGPSLKRATVAIIRRERFRARRKLIYSWMWNKSQYLRAS